MSFWTADRKRAARQRLDEIWQKLAAIHLRPPPKLKVSDWADNYRILSSEASAEPGRWYTSRNEPMREIMDAVTDPACHTVVMMTSSQVGKSETILNVVGYFSDQDPSPMLLTQPTLELGEAFSKDRVAPMIRDSKQLRTKFGDPRSRMGGNTLLHKQFPGGHLTIAGANSPASLASRPVRIYIGDEIDRYPASAGTEGDPVNLATKRTNNFWNRKRVLASTPGTEGISRIQDFYNNGDQRKGYLPCPYCGCFQILKWAQVKWNGAPDTAYYECEHCNEHWNETDRLKAIKQIEWRPHAPFRGTRSYHLWEAYSPWSSLNRIVEAFLEAKKSRETLKTFVNTVLGETWEEDSEKVDPQNLLSRVEDWGDLAPRGVLAITCGVDVQLDRLEIEKVGWGLENESWSLDHRIIYGDPSGPEIWKELDQYLFARTETHDGRSLDIKATCIDSGGSHTQAVYNYCSSRTSWRIWAIKGSSGHGRVLWPKRATKTKKGLVWVIGVDAGKDAVYARLKLTNPGPGYCHFPIDRDADYFSQLTSEIVETRRVKGFPTRVYILPGGRRNEALDCRVYAYAALQSLNIRWGRVLAAQSKPARPEQRDRAQENQVEETDRNIETFDGLPAPNIGSVAKRPSAPGPAIVPGRPRRQKMRRSSFMG